MEVQPEGRRSIRRPRKTIKDGLVEIAISIEEDCRK